MVTRTGIDQIKERPPSSRRAASAHRALAFRLVRFPRCQDHEKIPDADASGIFFMVTRTGIEPMLPP